MSSVPGSDKAVLQNQLKALAAESKSYAQQLSLEIIQSTVNDINTLEATKADKLAGVNVTIPTSGWVDDKTGTYRYHKDIPISGITAADRVDLTVAVASMDTAVTCGLCPTSETITNALRIRSAVVPAGSISATYWIHKAYTGTETASEEGDQ